MGGVKAVEKPCAGLVRVQEIRRQHYGIMDAEQLRFRQLSVRQQQHHLLNPDSVFHHGSQLWLV